MAVRIMRRIIISISAFLISIQCFSQIDSIKADVETKRKMIIAHQNADYYLKSFFGDSIFINNIEWDMFHSSVDAKNNFTYTNYFDTFSFIPQVYKLMYKIYQKGIFFDYFRLEADSLCKINITTKHFLYDDLIGYKKLINGNFKITQEKAIEIGEKYGIYGEGVYAKLINNGDKIKSSDYIGEQIVSYFWEVSIEDCEKCMKIHIDTNSGKIVSEWVVNKVHQF
jgi:hypothetical protein